MELIMTIVGILALGAFLVLCGYAIILMISDELYLLAIFLFLLVAVMLFAGFGA